MLTPCHVEPLGVATADKAYDVMWVIVHVYMYVGIWLVKQCTPFSRFVFESNFVFFLQLACLNRKILSPPKLQNKIDPMADLTTTKHILSLFKSAA